jgi:hypothetical protein
LIEEKIGALTMILDKGKSKQMLEKNGLDATLPTLCRTLTNLAVKAGLSLFLTPN